MSEWCPQGRRILARNPSPVENEEFADHVADCPECQRAYADQTAFERELVVWADSKDGSDPTPGQIQALVGRVRRDSPQSPPRLRHHPLRWLAVAAALILLPAATYLVWEARQTKSSPTPHSLALQVIYGRSFAPLPRDSKGAVLQTEETGQLLVHLGPNRVGLAEDSRVMVQSATSGEVALLHQRGSVACDVAPSASPFAVQQTAIVATVRGTRFMLIQREEYAASPLIVQVRHGAVQVRHRTSGQQQMVTAGQGLRYDGQSLTISSLTGLQLQSIDRLLREPTAHDAVTPKSSKSWSPQEKKHTVNTDEPPVPVAPSKSSSPSEKPAPTSPPPTTSRSGKPSPPFDYSACRQLILAGQLAVAQQRLEQRLQAQPRDGRGWELLAVVHRKRTQWPQAVKAHLQVVKWGAKPTANRARYMAGILYLEHLRQPEQAANLFSDYLLQPPALCPLAAEAKVRLAESYIALHKRKQAKQLLAEVIAQYPGSSVADKAYAIQMRHFP